MLIQIFPETKKERVEENDVGKGRKIRRQEAFKEENGRRWVSRGGYIPRCTFRPHLKTMRRPRSLPSTIRYCFVPFPPLCSLSIHGHSFATIRLDGQPSTFFFLFVFPFSTTATYRTRASSATISFRFVFCRRSSDNSFHKNSSHQCYPSTL